MSVDLIRYDLLVQDALRGVVGRVLTDVARDGLPGEHHLYLSFDTRAAGVRISPRLKERYPEEMTIVLQHQFWDLIVTDQFFEVGLSFNGIPERLHVPYAALKGFFDPSVKFGLQFETAEEDGVGETPAEPTAVAPTPIGEGRPTSVPSTRPPTRAAEPVKLETAAAPPAAPAPAAAAEGKAAAKPATVAPAAVRPAEAKPAGGKPSDVKAVDGKPADAPPSDDKGAPPADGDDPKDGGSGGAQVVRLDAFRKK
ncbi:SspB family protein [Ancylobacter polymorphus]|uniref:ClpXP protease specificity-enhancing factor SspB n=1 Tax=Ancylobacter polymorphus TaxID=223390 RepID=A0A9E7A1R1_9HYPH|nr:ClpXP protease specificity-enhancing factor SspB [Ancylobacter polymorphus]UOK72900.1 ClpXP protease specificity-enhancing factor SspB [Ancylobacter polymorphus]